MLEGLCIDFAARFGRRPTAAARAPGRVNLIGEHTDYNQGLVLPCAIDRDTWVAVAPRDDGRFRLVSRERDGVHTFDARELHRRNDWADYARGVVAALGEVGHALPGADVALTSAVPLGSGLSSSAALCVALVTAFDAAFSLGLSARERAQQAHRAESHYVGIACGVMDPMASALGEEGAALRIDCRTLQVERAALPGDRLGLLVAHSGVSRSLADGRYAELRGECESALTRARAIGIVGADAVALRDLDDEALPRLERMLPERLFRRARHVIRENARVDASVRALRGGDWAGVGELLKQGMASLREDFEVSIPELDALCALGDALPGVFGSRLTGAGFGGCTLHLVAAESADEVAHALSDGFERRFGRRPPIAAVRAGPGATAVALD